MPQAAAITINDGAATPVAKTFNPESVTPALSVFADRTLGISALFPRIAISTKFAGQQGGVNKSKYSVELPVGQVVNGIQTVVRTIRFNGEFILPDGCTDAERKDIFAYATNGMAHALAKAALRDLDPLY